MSKRSLPSAAGGLSVSVELIERRIYVIRGQKVMFDSDLAELYQVTTGNLNLAVRRNAGRFPEDFMFQLTQEEFQNLRLQYASSSFGYGGRRYLPYAFTEHGVAMLSSVLNSERAVQMNILIVRAFVKTSGAAGHSQRSGAQNRTNRRPSKPTCASPAAACLYLDLGGPGHSKNQEPADYPRHRLCRT
jgi:hypothetical protein